MRPGYFLKHQAKIGFKNCLWVHGAGGTQPVLPLPRENQLQPLARVGLTLLACSESRGSWDAGLLVLKRNSPPSMGTFCHPGCPKPLSKQSPLWALGLLWAWSRWRGLSRGMWKMLATAVPREMRCCLLFEVAPAANIMWPFWLKSSAENVFSSWKGASLPFEVLWGWDKSWRVGRPCVSILGLL